MTITQTITNGCDTCAGTVDKQIRDIEALRLEKQRIEERLRAIDAALRGTAPGQQRHAATNGSAQSL